MKTDEHAQGAVQGQGRLQSEGGPRANQAPEQEHSPGGANLCPDSSEIGSASPVFPRRLSREGAESLEGPSRPVILHFNLAQGTGSQLAGMCSEGQEERFSACDWVCFTLRTLPLTDFRCTIATSTNPLPGELIIPVSVHIARTCSQKLPKVKCVL